MSNIPIRNNREIDLQNAKLRRLSAKMFVKECLQFENSTKVNQD